jgi:hypothetical protein
VPVRRFTPIILIAAAAAAAIALIRSSDTAEPPEVWTPVNPS